MKVECTKVSGERLELEIGEACFVSDLKEKIAAMATSPGDPQAYPMCQQLTHEGQILQDMQIMESLANEDSESVLQLTLLFSMDGVVKAFDSTESQDMAVQVVRHVESCNNQVIQAFGAFLKRTNPSPKVKADLAATLLALSERHTSEEMEDVLLESLRHRSWRVREAAIQGLINISSETKMSKLINMIKKNHGKDKDEVDRDFSVNMAAAEALGEIPVGDEAAIEALILILTQLKAIWPARHIPCIETVLSSMGRTAFESESQSAETARSLVFRNFLHLSHQLLFEGVNEWQPRRRPDWKKIMIPLARRLVQRNGIPLVLSPKVMKHVVSQLRRSTYIKEKRIYQDFPYFDFACGERLHPQAVRLALRELLVASGNDLSLVLPLLSHPHDHSLRASAAYIILRRGHDAVDDVLAGLKGDGRQEILEAIVDTLLVMRESMPHMDKVVPALEELIEDDDFWIRRSVLFALWVAKHPPLEMTRAWITSTAVEAEAALDAIDPDAQDLICDALQHFDSEIRWMALMKLMTFHELPTSLQTLALDRKTGKLTNHQIPTPSRTRLDGGDVTVEQIQKLLLNPDEKPHVLRLSMGILYGLARAEHPKSLEVLQLLTDARRQYPYSMAVAILDNLKEPLPLHLPEKQWKSSSVKAIEDKVKKWADPTYYDRMAEQV